MISASTSNNSIFQKSENVIQEKHCALGSSMGKVITNLQAFLNDKNKEKLFELTIADPEPAGPFKTTRCGNCQLRGHKADGNRENKSCKFPAYANWKYCDQKRSPS